jgi:DNA-binding protein H-NS
MASLKELIAQREALERQIESTAKQERDDAIAKVRALMSEYGLSVADLSMKAGVKSKSIKGNKVAAKYRDKTTGDTWSGRGLQPKWLRAALAAGRKIGDFAV